MRKSTRFVACICNDTRDPECEAAVHLDVAGKLQLQLLFANIQHIQMCEVFAAGPQSLGEQSWLDVCADLSRRYYDRVELEQALDKLYIIQDWEELDLSEMFREL
jgi:hypothetical protein